MKPILTVIVPTKDAIVQITGLLNTFIADEHIEYLFVDSSVDGTDVFLESFGYQVIKTVPEGIMRAQNHGLAEAQGEWVHFMGADDAYLPHALEVLPGLLPTLGAKAVQFLLQLKLSRGIPKAYGWHGYQQGMVYRTEALRMGGGWKVDGTDLENQTVNEGRYRVGVVRVPLALALVDVGGRSSSLSTQSPNFKR